MTNRYLSAPEAATYLDISLTTMYKWLAAGHVPGARRTPTGRWRITTEQLDALAVSS